MKSPDFSPLAREYARSRPTYPAELYAWLASLVTPRVLAWDCATGNGQAARGLAGHFERVIGTDVSAEQIRHAAPHPRIEYRVAPAERSGLEDGSVDLVTVAAAIHWFDLDAFVAEARRVVRRGGALAAWTYHVGHLDPPLGELFWRLYRDVLAPYFAPGVKLVDDRYETLALPGARIEAPPFVMSAEWTLEQVRGFIASWSGAQKYREERGADPAALIADELERLWSHGGVRTVRWPLYVRASRL